MRLPQVQNTLYSVPLVSRRLWTRSPYTLTVGNKQATCAGSVGAKVIHTIPPFRRSGILLHHHHHHQ